MNGAWAMIKPRFATSMVSWMILAVQRKVLDFCLVNKLGELVINYPPY
jgi:hypothetical protein